jgi:phosphate transport system protein
MAKVHIVKTFTQELDKIKSKVLQMGRECEVQLAKSVDALVKRDAILAQDIIDGDREINRLQSEVDDLAVRMLALRQPMALDLRHVIAAQKMAADFERIADYAANIAKHAIELKSVRVDKPVNSIVKMANSALKMLGDVLDAYQDLDTKKAVEVWRRDDEIDKTYFGLLTILRTLMIEDSKSVTASTMLLFVGRCCERIGDHITNVAENVHFIVSGEMHHGRPLG